MTHGTPRADIAASARGAWPCSAIAYIIRPAPKMSLLIAEIAALITTRFRISAAERTPSAEKICTNGLPFAPTPVHGKIDISTIIVST